MHLYIYIYILWQEFLSILIWRGIIIYIINSTVFFVLVEVVHLKLHNTKMLFLKKVFCHHRRCLMHSAHVLLFINNSIICVFFYAYIIFNKLNVYIDILIKKISKQVHLNKWFKIQVIYIYTSYFKNKFFI